MTVEISVDGEDLLSLVRQVEEPYAAAEQAPSLAGRYQALLAEVLLEKPSYFLRGDAKVALYRCICGCDICWPLLVRISSTRDLVVWSEFEQPHRPAWRYQRLGPLVFTRRDYQRALDAAARAL